MDLRRRKAWILVLLLWACFGMKGVGKPATITVLQWNIWQEGTQVEGGYNAIVDELVRLRPDFVTFSEVRNYHGSNFIARLTEDLQKRGEKYYGFYSYDSGLLSRHPITDSLTVYPENGDHGSIYRLRAEVKGKKVAVYTAHLDYLNDAYYDVRGYDGSTWQEIPIPSDAAEVLRRNALSQRDEAIDAFLKQAAFDEADGYSIILGGDFNEPSHLDWTEATRDLYDHHGLVIEWPQTKSLERAGFGDAFRAVYPNPLTHPGFTFPADNPLVEINRLTWTPRADERERIDYIFFKGRNLKVTDCKIFGPTGSIAYSQRTENVGDDKFIAPLAVWPTDHKGLLVTFRMR